MSTLHLPAPPCAQIIMDKFNGPLGITCGNLVISSKSYYRGDGVQVRLALTDVGQFRPRHG